MASMLFVRDAAGSFAAVYSIRRDQWGSPGGGREPGEDPIETALRETLEETGLVVERDALMPCGYERFTAATAEDVIPLAAPYLQAYRTTLSATRPALSDGDSGIRETSWMTPREYAAHCGRLFWWPLAAAVFPELPTG